MDARGIESLGINDRTTLGQKLNILSKLEEKDVEHPLVIIDLKKLLPEACEIAEERNRYIHDQWIFNELKIAKGEINRLKIKRKNQLNINVFETDEKTFNINSLKDFLNKVIDIQERVGKIVDSIPIININNVELIKH